MNELLSALGHFITAKAICINNLCSKIPPISRADEQQVMQEAKDAAEKFAAVLTRLIETRVEEIVEAKLEACAQYAKQCSMRDVGNCFRRNYSM